MSRLGACLPAALIGLLVTLPAVPAPASKKDNAPAETTAHNLNRIALAFHEHHDEHDALPTNLKAKDGKPGLSWRVAILPYIEQKELYKEFRLDEPWNSEHNKKLIEKMPKLYAPVQGRTQKGQTYYQMFAGKQSLLDPGGRRIKLEQVTDGLSNTMMVAEAGHPVTWTEPEDMPYDGKDIPKLGGMFDGEFHVAMGDGSVHRIRKDADPETLRLLIDPADGQAVDVKDVRVEPDKK